MKDIVCPLSIHYDAKFRSKIDENLQQLSNFNEIAISKFETGTLSILFQKKWARILKISERIFIKI